MKDTKMKKDLKKLITRIEHRGDNGRFRRTQEMLREVERLREDQVRDLFRQWAHTRGCSPGAQLTGWKITGDGDEELLEMSFYDWPSRLGARVAVKASIPARYLDMAGHTRTAAFIEMHEKAAAGAEAAWTADRDKRIEALRLELARAEAEVFKPSRESRITAEEIEAAIESQLRDPAKLFDRAGFPGARRPSNAVLFAAAMRDSKGAQPLVTIRHRQIPVLISVPDAYAIATRHFEANGITDRASYLALAAELKRELREAHAAMPGLKAAIKASEAAGDSAHMEARALSDLHERHARAHDERVLMKAWAGKKIRDIRRAGEKARKEAQAAAA